MWIFDAHLDLAMNAIEWNRDLTQPLDAIRATEQHLSDKMDRGRGTTSLPEMRSGGILGCVATLIARVEHDAFSPVQGWRSAAQAWGMTQAQRAWYRCMEESGEMRLICDAASLQAHRDCAENATSESQREAAPIGFLLSLEGADALVNLDYLHRLHADGLRAVGPAHYGPGRYAFGTNSDGSLGDMGRSLLREMDSLNMILDVTHLCDTCFWEALEIYEGPIWASHQNCRALVPHNRQFSDEQFQALFARGAVIGAAMDAWMLTPDWVRGTSTPEQHGVTLESVADHIDHLCQLSGSDIHCGIGTDLDGAYGNEQTPADVKRIADVRKLIDVLERRGYNADALQRIASGNFMRFLENVFQ
ncbi:dipeptidase [Aureliella helgolandensis]|uniref:Membrane dipeptidase (Peptidase family M19) n=1 Tax=Aureliella helgolandensis TaxID=2527968 RepID=A0A518GAI7_9BACT|nr:membrane dipeptidase [Aureliella helgolandensis]QDV25601.1 Membrane dipeptidase (Peptidase family M19) [Aureliella helgolandensis]